MTNKVVLWVGGVVAVLLVAAIIVGIVLVNTIRAEAERQAFKDCMARQGYAADELAAPITDEKMYGYIGKMTDAARFCSR